MKTVGLLGAGQLGCMLAASLQTFGARVRFFDPDPGAPGRAMTESSTCAPWTDADALARFFSSCDVVSYEFENVDVRHLSSTSALTGVPLWPSAGVLAVTQSRESEKGFLATEGLPCAPFRVLCTREDLDAFARAPDLPIVVKSLRGGYDGKGQRFVRRPEDFAGLEDFLPCLVEEALPLALEASVIVGRDARGNRVAFPPFENVHAHHILDTTLFPAPSLDVETVSVLTEIAMACAERLGVVGLLTTEFFLTDAPANRAGASGWLGGLRRGGRFWIGVNEFAPRPHNSGHVTRQACHVSQFDLHARILLELPLPARETLAPVGPGTFAMGNLLGDVWLAQGIEKGDALTLGAWAAHPDVLDVTLYGKETARPGRKMGHFCVRAPDGPRARAAVRAFRRTLSSPTT